MDDFSRSARELAEAMGGRGDDGVQLEYGTVSAVSGGSMSVALRGATVPVLRTTACESAAPGDRVVLLGQGRLWTAVGVVSEAGVFGTRPWSYGRRCFWGQESDAVVTAGWHLVARVTGNQTNGDRTLIMLVSCGYNNYNAAGLLRAHIRTNSAANGGAIGRAHLSWDWLSDRNGIVTPSNVVLAHNASADFVCELWWRDTVPWRTWCGTVLDERERYAPQSGQWQLYDDLTSGKAAPTAGYAQVASQPPA